MWDDLVQWLDERAGVREFWKVTMSRKIPEVNWFYTLGSTTMVVALLQAVTGILMTAYYVPTPEDAYSSVQYIVHDVTLGAYIRGMHHWGASFMVALVFLHMLRVYYMGAYKYPRELTWVVGVFLFLFTLGSGFTGYLLPWDQRAYWATTVGTNIAGVTPFIGHWIKLTLRGTPDVSGVTLARFYGFHVWFLPALIYPFIGLHLYLVIRNGITNPPSRDE